MTARRIAQLTPYVQPLAAALLRSNNVRALGTSLRHLRDKGILTDLGESRWLQSAVLSRANRDRAYYERITPEVLDVS